MTILRSCFTQNSIRSGTRAIVPSSFITSQITPAELRPASRARSTAASVWPARSSTPPRRARSGNTCPGSTRSSRPFDGSIATWIVRARSWAEMPVEMPSRASIETVNAVPYGVSLRSVIWRRPSSSQRSPVRQRQISPRPSFAMNAIASGVANWAAIVEVALVLAVGRVDDDDELPARGCPRSPPRRWRRRSRRRSSHAHGTGKPLDVLGQDVDLEIDRVAAAPAPRASSRRACAASSATAKPASSSAAT